MNMFSFREPSLLALMADVALRLDTISASR
jgi:hypothetical protein